LLGTPQTSKKNAKLKNTMGVVKGAADLDLNPIDEDG